MKFISWNVNGLRACVQKGFLDFFNSIDAVCFWIFQVDLIVCDIQITAQYDRLFGIECLKIFSEIILPLHTVRQVFQTRNVLK